MLKKAIVLFLVLASLGNSYAQSRQEAEKQFRVKANEVFDLLQLCDEQIIDRKDSPKLPSIEMCVLRLKFIADRLDELGAKAAPRIDSQFCAETARAWLALNQLLDAEALTRRTAVHVMLYAINYSSLKSSCIEFELHGKIPK